MCYFDVLGKRFLGVNLIQIKKNIRHSNSACEIDKTVENSVVWEHE